MQFTFLCELCTTRCRNFKGLRQINVDKIDLKLRSSRWSNLHHLQASSLTAASLGKAKKVIGTLIQMTAWAYMNLVHYIENPHFYFSAIYLSTSLHHDAFKTDKWAKATWTGLFEHYCYSKVLYVYTFNVYNLCMNV